MMCKIVCTVLIINPKESLSEAHEEQLAAAYYNAKHSWKKDKEKKADNDGGRKRSKHLEIFYDIHLLSKTILLGSSPFWDMRATFDVKSLKLGTSFPYVSYSSPLKILLGHGE